MSSRGEQRVGRGVQTVVVGPTEALIIVTGRLDKRELVVARYHARVGPLQGELCTRRIRHHEQVRGGVTVRRFGVRQGRACYQTAEGGRRYGEMTNSGEVDTEPFPASLRRSRDLLMYRQDP
jgi:hypothetical protein